jgi:chromosome segregation ATPase
MSETGQAWNVAWKATSKRREALVAEIERLNAQVERLQEINNDQQIQIERLIEDRDRPQVITDQVQAVNDNQLKMIAELRAENERLRAQVAAHHTPGFVCQA